MKYSIVYSSRTGNTKQLAEAIRKILPEKDCIYFGEPDDAALLAERIYAGFWTNQGVCNEEISAFLEKVTGQEIFLFGTAGFGVSREYFDKILARTAQHISKEVNLIGSFMCQGKMPIPVRERYEKMAKSPEAMSHMQVMIDNFDKALSHPDADDLAHLQEAVRAIK